ncbi:MAG: circadian clock KaiB domain protein [Candidatus Acidoferrum typicum]|nr:circadian clock KaiB domain protein [Candidatus Acidoferrum typicum]
MGKQVLRRAKARFEFCVYIAKHTLRSDLALKRLKKICHENVPGDYEIEVIDIAKRPDLAKDRQIVATPAVFRTLPAPLRKFIGDLSQTDKALLGLDLFTPLKSRRPRGKKRKSSVGVPQAAD